MRIGKPDLEVRRAQSLARQIFLSSRALAVAVTKKVRVEDFQFGMAHIAILPAIDLEGTRLTEIAQRAGMTKQALFPYISELEAHGFLTKIKDPQDRRANLLLFTAKGRSLLERIHHALADTEKAVAAALGAQGYATVRNGLEHIAALVQPRSPVQTRASQASGPLQADLFVSAFTHAAIGMALVSLDGRCLDVNESLCDIVGYTKAELLRLTFQDITHPEDLEADLGLAQRLLDGEISSYHLQKRYSRKNGDIVWVLLTRSLVRHADGSPCHFIAQVQDIQQRRQDGKARNAFWACARAGTGERTSCNPG